MRLFREEIKAPLIKTQLVIFLAILAVFLSLIGRDAAFLISVILALVSAGLIDGTVSYLRNKKFAVSESSMISALIIAFVLASDSHWWVIILTCFFALCSKYIIRLNGKHIFNPAAFGIVLSMFLLQANTQWRGTYLWFILAPVGLYFVFKIRKVELLSSYLATALGLFLIQALIRKTPIGDIFGYLSYFYIFIMLIEPKTTPIKPVGKIIFGVSVAILIFILTERGVSFDVELAALLVLNMFVPLLNKIG